MHNDCEQPNNWKNKIIKQEEIDKYLVNNEDFIDVDKINLLIESAKNPDDQKIKDIIQKALSVKTLSPEETASLINVTNENLWQEIFAAAAQIKTKVYDNRVVTFAPLYCGNFCVNNCLYCGFRGDNAVVQRRILTFDEIKQETEILAGKIGHKRLIAVYGEHPKTGAEYIAESLRTIYKVKVPVRKGYGNIRRVNVNAAPMSIEDSKIVKDSGIGTYQVFQETYHKPTYSKLHPAGTLKGEYRWRLYALHRAMEAGIDDVAVGALFGLYDWRFEVMGLLAHAIDLERYFGIGPHTVSMPRIEPAINTAFYDQTQYKVRDDHFKKLIAILRLSIPYAGMIITCRETSAMIREVIPMCTQRDASSKIGIGAYTEENIKGQQESKQQFILGDTRSLDEVIRELAGMGYITSFCTAGYRCGRTGKDIMNLLRTGKEGCFCKLNAILTFQEWLEDFSSPETYKIGEAIIEKEVNEVKQRTPAYYTQNLLDMVLAYRQRIKNGERDLWF